VRWLAERLGWVPPVPVLLAPLRRQTRNVELGRANLRAAFASAANNVTTRRSAQGQTVGLAHLADPGRLQARLVAAQHTVRSRLAERLGSSGNVERSAFQSAAGELDPTLSVLASLPAADHIRGVDERSGFVGTLTLRAHYPQSQVAL
jgi:hypothetical protein